MLSMKGTMQKTKRTKDWGISDTNFARGLVEILEKDRIKRTNSDYAQAEQTMIQQKTAF